MAKKEVGKMAPVLIETPVKEIQTPKTPEEELQALEEEALRLGMSPEELAKIRAIGRCPSQIQTRILILRCWLSTR